MEVMLGWYLLFALTTSLTAVLELFKPVMQEISILYPEDMIAKSPITTYGVMFLMGVLTAPVLIIPCIVPEAGETFRNVIRQSLVG